MGGGHIVCELNESDRLWPRPFRHGGYRRWPLEVGHSWAFQNPVADGRVCECHVKATRWEEVTVPAGRFNALVIEIDGQPKGGDQWRARRTIWYASAAKWRVKMEAYEQVGTYIQNREVYELESIHL